MKHNTGRILALDYGTSRVGIAISDPSQCIAFPRATFLNDETLLDKIVETIAVEKVVLVLVGRPYQTDHRETMQTWITDGFVKELSQRTSVRIEMRDEKLTSFEARELVATAGDKQVQKQITADKDQLAAMILLKEYLAEQG